MGYLLPELELDLRSVRTVGASIMDVDFIYAEVVRPLERIQISLTPQELVTLRQLVGGLSLNSIKREITKDEEAAQRIRDLCGVLYFETEPKPRNEKYEEE